MSMALLLYLFFLLMVIFGFGALHIMDDPDTAWHLATGDLLAKTGSLPLHDSWSFTANEEVWYNLSWGFDYLLSRLFHLGGFSTLYVVTEAAFSLAIILMLAHCLKRGASMLSVLIVFIPVTFVVSGGLLIRPHLVSLLFIVVFYQILDNYRITKNPYPLLSLPVLMMFWVNLHGGFLLVFPLMGCFWLDALSRGDKKSRIILLVLLLACMLASLLNPYHFAIYYAAYRSIAGEFSHYIIEWQPVAVGKDMAMTIMLFLVLASSNALNQKLPLSDKLIAIFMLLMGLSSKRHSLMAGLLSLPYLSLSLTCLLGESRWGERLNQINDNIKTDMEKKDVRVLSIIMAVLACCLVSFPYPRDRVMEHPPGFNPLFFPDKEAAFIMAHYPNLHFYNDYNLGGYLVYIGRGKIPLFVDGRANSLYSDDFLSDYHYFQTSHGMSPQSVVIANYYHLDGLIISNADGNAVLWDANPDWKVVYRGKVANVYVRSGLGSK